MKTEYDRWNDKISKDTLNGCWEWTAAKYRGGYGHFRRFIDGTWKMCKAHRYSYEYHNNLQARDMKDRVVCHTCDNPGCVNPSHLFLGYAIDNIRDKITKGRGRWGVKEGFNKLSYEIAENIRRTHERNKQLTLRELGILFNTSPSQVHRVLRNKTWKKPFQGGLEN